METTFQIVMTADFVDCATRAAVCVRDFEAGVLAAENGVTRAQGKAAALLAAHLLALRANVMSQKRTTELAEMLSSMSHEDARAAVIEFVRRRDILFFGFGLPREGVIALRRKVLDVAVEVGDLCLKQPQSSPAVSLALS